MLALNDGTILGLVSTEPNQFGELAYFTIKTEYYDFNTKSKIIVDVPVMVKEPALVGLVMDNVHTNKQLCMKGCYLNWVDNGATNFSFIPSSIIFGINANGDFIGLSSNTFTFIGNILLKDNVDAGNFYFNKLQTIYNYKKPDGTYDKMFVEVPVYFNKSLSNFVEKFVKEGRQLLINSNLNIWYNEANKLEHGLMVYGYPQLGVPNNGK